MNHNAHYLAFSEPGGHIVAVAETISSKSTSGTYALATSQNKFSIGSKTPPNSQFSALTKPIAQQIRAQAAPILIVRCSTYIAVNASNAIADHDLSMRAGNNVNITATGDGQASNILIQGSAINAGNNALLSADNQINLLAAKNESSQTSSNSSSSSSVGASYGVTSSTDAAVNNKKTHIHHRRPVNHH